MQRPNVLIVTTHDTGRFVEPYGVATVETPNLNRLAAEGVRFDAYTTAPQCSPSRASLTTGRYPHANGTMGLTHGEHRWDLDSRERTIPQILRTAGYRSGHWGVEHAARDPRRIGNDVYDESPDVASIIAGVAAFIDADPERPFVVQIGLTETHRVSDHGFGGAPFDARGITVPAYLRDAPGTRADLADFQGCVNRADAHLGQILKALEERELLDGTLVLFVSDHGIAFPRAKCTLYDPGVEISLIARLPGTPLTGGAAPDGMASIMDVVPTLIELTGAEAPSYLHGASLLPLAAGASPGHAELFVEKTYHSYYDPMRGIRTDGWKYIRNFEAGLGVEVPADVAGGGAYRDLVGRLEPSVHAPAELYDLELDPNERSNLAGHAEYARIEAELEAKLAQWMHETRDPLLDGPVASPFYRRAVHGLLG
ncbi:MAG: sulfatase [Chloroflexi bacterium]|nr:sulfatase [Chloroflexota bacterium]